MTTHPNRLAITVNQFAAVLAAAVGLTMVYWWPMWLGDGVVGGDIMDYFLPQKVYLSKSLASGDIPLWNNLVNLGYPFVADSQIAMWYPTTIPLYSMMSVEAAFQTNILIHYVLAYVFTWAYARSIGLRQWGAMLAALAFTYGWFPPRLSVEWAITTGCYLPATLFCVERWLRTAHRRWLLTLAVLLTLQLLAGHFSLTFINHVMLGVYIAARLTFARRRTDAVAGWKPAAWVLAMQVVAFPMAACQLAPTWELRQQSQRGGLPIPEVEDGRVPWKHLRQLVMPWVAYNNDMSEYPPPYTNGPAASLFIGVLPFLLALYGMTRLKRRDAAARIWRFVIPIAIVFAVGWLTDIYKYLPGFGYFKIPGRYSLLAALGLSILAGAAVDRLRVLVRNYRLRPSIFAATLTVVTAVTVADLYQYGRTVAFTTFVPMTVDEILADSQLGLLADEAPQPLRMLVPGNNALTCTGISAVPGFLGLAPAAYVNEETKLSSNVDPSGPLPGQVARLQQAGVTHIIFERPFDAAAWQCEQVGVFADSFLSRVMDRFDPATGQIAPWHLAALTGRNVVGRVSAVDENDQVVSEASCQIVQYQPDHVTIDVELPEAARVVLADLMFPGWSVRVDGQPADAVTVHKMQRGVAVTAGSHTVEWTYQPASIRIGWTITGVTLAGLITLFLTLSLRDRRVSVA